MIRRASPQPPAVPAALRRAFDIHFGASFHEITDGISSTFAMGETGGGSSTSNFRSNHPDVCGFLYADGAVAFLGAAIDSQAYRALSTIQAGDATRP